MRSIRLVLAFFIAAAFAIFAFPLAVCAAWLAGLDSAGGSCSGTLTYFGWHGSLVVVPAALLFGFPLLLVCHRRNWMRWWQIGIVGLFVGICAAIGLDFLDQYLVWYRFVILSAPLGFLSGLAFWLVGIFRNVGPNNSFKPTPHRGSSRVHTLR